MKLWLISAPNKDADKDQYQLWSVATVCELTLTLRHGRQKGISRVA